MDKLKIETSIPFPFFKINESVTYSEVKKPSGIAYILLVLINESKDKTEKLFTVLERFGIPKNLHYIFADTLHDLMDLDILEKNNYFSSNNYMQFNISDFNFTPKGQKIFEEEAIPTGINKNDNIDVFYEIAKNQLSLKLNPNLHMSPLQDSPITPEFMGKFQCNKNVEDFLNLQKGKGIIIKKEEVITKVEQNDCENLVGKYNCILNIDGDKISIQFKDEVLQRFFEANYTNEMVNKTILYKNKFKFKNITIKNNIRLSNFNSGNIVKIFIPEEIDEILKPKCQLLLTKGNYSSLNSYVIKHRESLEKYNKNVEYIQVDMQGNVFAFVPGLFEFENEILGTITIPLLLKIKVSMEELQQIVLPYIESIKNYSENNFKALVKLTNITKDSQKAFEVIENYLSNNDVENNIVLLNEIRQSALSNASILDKYKELLKKNYFEYLNSINEDNLDSTLKITSSIPQFLNIQPKDILPLIFTHLTIKNTVDIYQTLVKYGFDKELTTLFVNPVPATLKNRNVTEKSLVDLLNYNDTIDTLKKITNVDDYKKYTFNEEEIDKKEFQQAFNIAFNLTKNIKIFKSTNKEIFETYEGFMQVFSRINDDINMLASALKNPKNIKRSLIKKKIASGDYQFVFVNLSAKLELILKNKFRLDGNLSDMLSEARRQGLVDKDIIRDLHTFRENRNACTHPEDRELSFTANDLRRWNNKIFDLEEIKMSRQVTVDYQGISIQVQAQCETAIHSLCRIDKVLERIHQTSSKLETSKIQEYEAYLLESKEKIKNKIEELQKTLEKYKDARAQTIYEENSTYNNFLNFKTQVETESRELKNLVNDLTGSQLAVIDQMIDEELLNAGKQLLNKMHGIVDIQESILGEINQIEDISLRELAYREALKPENKGIAYKEIFSKAQDEYDILLGKKTRQVIEEYGEELKSNGISPEKLENISSISQATAVVNDAITDEKVRKETLKIIIKAIKARGFIVDTKKNLKIDRQRNVVKLVALKASGQKAEFEIQLNGKFMYHFDEYEGQACKKDIEPFLEDLKNIYDINITHEEVNWENPDKIQTQKYQYAKKNKRTN